MIPKAAFFNFPKVAFFNFPKVAAIAVGNPPLPID